MVKYRVTLTEQERAGLKKMVSAGKGAARKLWHARILLLTDVGERGRCFSDDEITDALEISRSTILTFPYRDFSEYACGLADDTP